MHLTSSRIVLRQWSEAHRGAFAAMNVDPEVMADLGGPISRAASDEKFDRYAAGWGAFGTSRWAIEDHSGEYLGYAGVMFRPNPRHPLGAHHEIGWRLCRSAWGKGYATESATLALGHAWQQTDIPVIFSYTAPDNLRSQAMMQRLALKRDAARDYKVCSDEFPQG